MSSQSLSEIIQQENECICIFPNIIYRKHFTKKISKTHHGDYRINLLCGCTNVTYIYHGSIVNRRLALGRPASSASFPRALNAWIACDLLHQPYSFTPLPPDHFLHQRLQSMLHQNILNCQYHRRQLLLQLCLWLYFSLCLCYLWYHIQTPLLLQWIYRLLQARDLGSHL